MINSRFSWLVFTAAVLFMSILAISTDAQAQSNRKTASVKPAPTPTPTSGGDAQVISRASDPQEPTVLVMQPQAKTEPDSADSASDKVKELAARVKNLESAKADPYDERQKRLLLNLDILTRAEQRSESLRKQLFEMIEKESSVKTRLEQNEFESRPENINRAATFSGSMRPEEIRDLKKKSLDAEHANLQDLLNQIQATKATLAVNLAKSETLVEKLRSKLEKDIDDSFKDDNP
jgi:hypothetical protein